MNNSKYAPKTPAEALAHSKAQKLSRDKEGTTRLLGRLRWKAELLMVSYYRTMEIVHAELQNSAAREAAHHAMGSGATSASAHVHRHATAQETNMIQRQAESMFKVDFFEWYALLERYITDCLAVFGFSVSSSAPRNNVIALRYLVNPNLHATRPLASHAFHANLLEALDDEKCPFHASLGTHPIRAQLALAKDYRNAWKGADEKAALSSSALNHGDARKNISLHDLQLELMLRALVSGCEQAHSLVQNQTATIDAAQSYGYSSMDTDDQPFEYMDDAMDLD